MRIRVELTGVDRELAKLSTAFDAAMGDWAERAGGIVAATAQRNHPYTDRTHNLTDSTEGGAPRGRFMADTLETSAVAGMDYAEYVDENPSFRFLEPAYRSAEPELEEDAERALEHAARAAGW